MVLQLLANFLISVIVVKTTMATRIAARYVSRRLSSGGKVLGEEEKAAENVYIKKMEQERLAKAARKGPQAEEKTTSGSADPISDAKPTGPSSSTSNVSTDKYRNYAVLAGTVTAIGAVGWYLLGSKKKTEEVHDNYMSITKIAHIQALP
ncbi:hypothetical protein V2J09_006942 [Rumex salicifolius]